MAERRTLTIESNYCKEWTIRDAIREIIQNALDTGTKINIKPCVLDADGKVKFCVADNGVGIKLSDFIIGRSSKRENNKVIGQFGEGLKIGCLVLAREGRQVSILSLNKKYIFSIQYDGTWQEKLLTIDIDDSPTEQIGTSVILECSQEEMQTATSLFLALNPLKVIDNGRGTFKGSYEIIDGNPGIVWVNGLAVTKVDAVYGYKFKDKDLVNRDRTAINTSAIKSAVAKALSATYSRDIIRNLLTIGSRKAEDGKTPAEFDVMFTPNRNTWRSVVREMYGTKVCRSSGNPKVDLAAIEKNWVVLALPWSFNYSLKNILPDATQVLKDNKKIVPLSRLSASDREFFDKGKRIADEIAGEAGLKVYPVKIFIDNEKKNEARLFNFNQTGYYLNGVAGICLETIKSHDIGKMVGTLMHEYTHGTCGHEDNSRDFENDLTDIVASLGLALINERAKAKQNRGLNYAIKTNLTT
jgi:hypothetical protein